MPRAVVLFIDGLGTKFLGPYGNTWLETPAFNHLAAESFLMDGVFAPFRDQWKSLDAMWRGRTAIGQGVESLQGTDLLSRLSEEKITTHLLTDDPDLVDQPLTSGFSVQTDVPPAKGIDLADEWDETHAATFFAQAVSAVDQLEPNSLLWLHTRGLGNPWDAPYEYRGQFADEEDPDPSGSAQVPSLLLDEDHDPDTLHEIQCAIGGQVALLDRCLGVLLSVIRQQPDVLFLVSSLRGFPLGEHLQVGWGETTDLFHELLHVPVLVRYPDGNLAMKRSRGIGELCDSSQCVVDWFAGRESAIQNIDRKFSLSSTDDQLLLRTPVWQLRFPESVADVAAKAELYLKPDDQNEVNDVASRCGQVVEAGREFALQLRRNNAENIELPDILMEPIE